MLHDNSLSERLNAVKEGKPIPEPPKQENTVQQPQPYVSLKDFFISEAYKTFQVLSTSLLYGFGLKALFSADWTFMGLFGVGIIANHILSHTITFISKLFKK